MADGYYAPKAGVIYGTASPNATEAVPSAPVGGGYLGGVYPGGGGEQDALSPSAGDPSPVTRAALQNSVFQMNQTIKEAAVVAGVYVPPGTGHGPNAPQWATQPGLGNLPKIGWTVQNSGLSPVPVITDDHYDYFAPYDESSSYDGPSKVPFVNPIRPILEDYYDFHALYDAHLSLDGYS